MPSRIKADMAHSPRPLTQTGEEQNMITTGIVITSSVVAVIGIQFYWLYMSTMFLQPKAAEDDDPSSPTTPQSVATRI
jgi:hypothetical protein